MKAAFLVVVLALWSTLAVEAAPEVKHPNLLLNREEIEAVKAKIAKYPWAADALEETRKQALTAPEWENGFLNAALYYTFTGEKAFADRARGYLLGHVNDQNFVGWGLSWGAVAW